MKIDPKRFHPVEYKILIKPDEDTDPRLKAAKAAGIQVVETTSERDKIDAVCGVLISVGGRAFEDFGNPTPKVGDRIHFSRYAGQMLEGIDGSEYRLASDKDVCAIEVSN